MMNERHTPHHEQPSPHLSDEELVEAEITRAVLEKRPISHAGARVISSMIHEGQLTALYALASSGAILEGLPDELENDYNRADRNDQTQIRTWVVQLMAYVEGRESTEPIDGWSSIWLQQPELEDAGLDDEDCCAECGEHFANPHHPTCSRSPEDFPEEDDSFQPEPAEADPRAELEAKVQAKLGHISTGNLVRRMERAEDFSTDDEEIELTRRLREQGKDWRWSESFTYPQVIIYDLPEDKR